VTGNLGIISVFPIVTFYASGILVKADYESMSWAVREKIFTCLIADWF
jgi:hypothetical protein